MVGKGRHLHLARKKNYVLPGKIVCKKVIITPIAGSEEKHLPEMVPGKVGPHQQGAEPEEVRTF
jgi:hypothetical protein